MAIQFLLGRPDWIAAAFGLAMTVGSHCEEHSDEAIQGFAGPA